MNAGHEQNLKFFNLPFSSKRSSIFLFVITFLLFLLLLFRVKSFDLFSLPSISSPPEAELNGTRPILNQLVTFFPLKDLKFADRPTSGRTWFMSSFNDSFDGGDSQYLYFPSMTSNGRFLCISARDVSNGTRNSYALAWPEALPDGAALLPGLTFVSDTFYDYDNLWHGLGALLPFASWHQRKQCVVPARWVLFHRGELRTTMGKWVRTLAEATIGEVRIEDFGGSDGRGGGVACFEKAVVFRHNEGAMRKQRRREVYAGMRCRARAHCGVVGDRWEEDSMVTIRLTLLLRLGSRAFKNESAVIGIFERECARVEGCRVQVAWGNNMTFCDQVKLMRETDVLVSPHGAQLANLFLMEEKSSIMEFYPKGWSELAGAGQYVYRWMADAAGMQHKGSWQDPEGDQVECGDVVDQHKCFGLFKDGKIGVDEKYFTQWSATVLKEAKEMKLIGNGQLHIPSTSCLCM
ncbi:uncharacterized protein LOC122022988 [Zingiber officinale]|uniref:Glycosyltransferase 61 catalytic domain-containing protein n=1 Tax=Zingiber officinale TaxID=94328 RepID=A0A8J5KBH4_ZINOF|nr:uncharacterized protein LOC122022988 [Zingiber officinale]KAG6476236.1 hypothetical protein ZIOFF_065474 [Zingiber officinale]